MSKFSPKEKITSKLAAAQEEYLKGHLMEDDLTPEQIENLDRDLFTLEEVDDAEAERTGYSNYSYWGSTLRMFLKNKVAVFNLIVMLVLVLFTFIQPYLPNQFDPNYVNYYDSKAVWYLVEDDGSYKAEGISYTKGDHPVALEANETLAYINTPYSWGTPECILYDKDGNETRVEATALPNNDGWYYVVSSKDAPHMAIQAEDGTKSTFVNAVWLIVHPLS